MSQRITTTGLAGPIAILLTFALSGVVAGATLVADTVDPTVDAPLAGLAGGDTFEDTDGNGVDDDCQEAVVADPDAAAEAEAAVDADGDGTISVPEAAHSDRVGGPNCNHGGYVSIVAQDDGTAEEPTTEDPAPAAECPATEPEPGTTGPDPAVDPEPVAPNAHGKAVSEIAQSDAVGGKHCNHGGAVSEAAKDKAAHEAAKAERAAAKAERDAARAAAKAAREAAKAERAAAREAAKTARQGAKSGH